jgi:transcriptional regulator with XRE-family HTH domain
MRSYKRLRLRRLCNDITARQLAKRLAVSDGWVRSLEKNRYRGPAAETWHERYREALDTLIAEKKAKAAKR